MPLAVSAGFPAWQNRTRAKSWGKAGARRLLASPSPRGICPKEERSPGLLPALPLPPAGREHGACPGQRKPAGDLRTLSGRGLWDGCWGSRRVSLSACLLLCPRQRLGQLTALPFSPQVANHVVQALLNQKVKRLRETFSPLPCLPPSKPRCPGRRLWGSQGRALLGTPEPAQLEQGEGGLVEMASWPSNEVPLSLPWTVYAVLPRARVG